LFIADAYAWVEYFRGSEKGKRAAGILDDPKKEILTLERTLAEVKCWALRERKPFDDLYVIIRRNSRIVHSTVEDWLRASELRFEIRRTVPGFGLMDALLLAAAERSGSRVLTGDAHFRKISNVVFLG
jgi:predicted nucleic acid-binding protein